MHFLTAIRNNVKIDKGLDYLIFIFLLFSFLLPPIAFFEKDIYYTDYYYYKALILYICAGTLIILGFIKLLISGFKVKDMKIVVPVLVLASAVIVSSLLSKYKGEVLWGNRVFHEGALTLISYYVIFIFSRHFINTEDKLKKVITWIWVVGVVIYIYCFLQIFIRIKVVPSIIWGGTFGHRNYMASFYTLILLPAISLYFYSKNERQRFCYFILSCIFFSSLILVHTRSAWVGSFVGMILLFILIKKKIALKEMLLLLTAFVLIITAVNFSNNGLISTRFQSMVKDVKILSDAKSDKTFVGTSRYEIWKLGVGLIPKYFLFGAGPDMLEHVFPQKEYQKAIGNYGENVANAHNEYLNMLLTVGIFALAGYLWLIVLISGRFYTAYRNSDNESYTSYLVIGIFCGWTAYLVQAFFNNSVVPTSPTLWAVMGILAAVCYKDPEIEVYK